MSQMFNKLTETSVRLEADPRATDPRDGAQIPLADPAWILARQWWVGEFDGYDGGTPIGLRFDLRVDPFSEAIHMVPSEALAASVVPQNQNSSPQGEEGPDSNDSGDWRSSLRLGQRILGAFASAIAELRHLPPGAFSGNAREMADAAERAVAELVKTFPMAPDHPALRRAAPERRLDGFALVRALKQGDLTDGGLGNIIRSVLGEAEFGSSFDIAAGQTQCTLVPESNMEIVASAAGPRLHASDLSEPAAVEGEAQSLHVVPARLTHAGGPPQRWWSQEEPAFAFSASPAGPSDLGQLVIAQALSSQRQSLWEAAFEIPANSIFAVSDIVVEDTFSVRKEAEPMQTAAARGWRHGGPTAPIVNLTEGPHLISPPVDEVRIAVDEGDNLVWMTELQAVSGTGWPRTLNGDREDRDVTAAAYALRLSPPDTWIPYSVDGGRLVKRPLSQVAGFAPSATQFAVPVIDCLPSQIGAGGRGFVSGWRIARSPSGRRATWMVRWEVAPSVIGGSGLAHDVILRPEP